jgi:hypothetical protein
MLIYAGQWLSLISIGEPVWKYDETCIFKNFKKI